MNPMDNAPKDGTHIIAYGPWTGSSGVEVWWKTTQGLSFWACDGGIAAYEFSGWDHMPNGSKDLDE